METINQRIDEDYLLGYIKYHNSYSVYLMPIAYWILNYSKYDPGYNGDDWQFVFRNNILNVMDDKIDDFLNSISYDKINDEEIGLIKPKVKKR